jgi:thiol-disulfide isomerase/thioredoxin
LSAWLKPARIWDALAILAILFVVWKIFIAPRSLDAKNAYPAPPTSYARLDGGTFHVRDARGRMLLLDFYASWCTPCRVELPLVESWAKSHPEVQVVLVDVGEPRGVVDAFARKLGLTGVAYDPQDTATVMFSLQGYPTLVVIDPSNRVRAKWEGLNPAVGLALDNAEKTFAGS